jgi:TetR/AcrR family transcriptional regulator
VATRDPEATKRRILAAALREFSAKGIAGARVDAIASRAKVNKRMLYYYFQSKDGLFREILRRRMQRSASSVAITDLPLDEQLVRLRRAYDSQDDYVRLLMWEALQMKPNRPLEDEEPRREAYQRWVEQTKQAQSEGRLPADLDAAQLVLSHAGLAIVPVAFPQLVRFITGMSPDDPEFVAAREEFLRNFARLLARGDGETSTGA